MTTVLNYRLRAESAVSAGNSGEVVHRSTMHTELPGSTVRGALAAAWWAEFGSDADAAERFAALFESAMTVRPAVADGRELRGVSEVRCKYPSPDCPRGWHDNASGITTVTHCPTCHGALKAGSGWTDADGGGGPRIVSRTRVALTDSGVAEDETLFTRTSIQAGICFEGAILLDETAGDQRDVTWLHAKRSVAVGGQRSVLGHMAWSTEPALYELRASGNVLRCWSPTILTDEFGAPTLDPQPTLRRLLAAPHLRVTNAWVRSVIVGGWHMQSRLPKQDDWALAPGSTFVLDGLPPNTVGPLQLGVGLRTLEGYGDVHLLAPSELSTFGGRTGTPTQAVPAVAAAPTLPATPAADEPVALGLSTDILRFAERVPTELRLATLRGMLAATRRISMLRDNGFTGGLLTGPIGQSLEAPWARDLHPDTRAAATELLGSEQLAEVRALLQAELDRETRV